MSTSLSAWWSRASMTTKLLAGLGAVLLATLPVVAGYYLPGLLSRIGGPDPTYSVDVEVNPDDIPGAGGPVGGFYFIPGTIEDVGAPPSDADTCVGRYEWATELGGFQAMSSTARVSVDAETGETVHIEDVKVKVERASPPPAGTFIACGGRGGQTDVREVNADLDTDPPQILTTEAETGEPIIFNFQVRPDDPAEVFHVTGATVDCDCSWRLELYVRVGDESDTVVIPDPDDPPFRTVSPVNARAYRWQQGEWREQERPPMDVDVDLGDGLAGAGPPPTAPGSLPDCPIMTTSDVAAVLGGDAWTLVEARSGQRNGISGLSTTETRCDFSATEQSVSLVRSVAATPEEAQREFDARIPFYAPNGEPTTPVDTFGYTAIRTGGYAMLHNGNEVVVVGTFPFEEPTLTALTQRTIATVWPP